MICEMCGDDVEALSQVRVEGTVLALCGECGRFGTPVAPPPATTTRAPPGRPGPVATATRLTRPGRRLEERDLFSELPDLDLAPDWAKRIRTAREQLGWTPDDLGKRLNEKKSVVLKMEAGSFRPPDALIPRIEHLLKVRLRADPARDGAA